MAVDDRLSDLLVEWEHGWRSGQEPSLEELCRDTPDLLPIVRESIDSLRATDWMFRPEPNEPFSSESSAAEANRAALHDTELPASHLTVQEFAASIFQSGLLSRDEIDELKSRLDASALSGEAREIASKLVTEGKLTRYQAAVLLKASKDPLLVDNYVILDTLDTGGMGLVFKALHRSMNRVVALKLLPASMMSARDTVKRFQREVQAAAALKHPNVVAAYDADESEEIAYLVLEYVEGTNLYRLVKEQGPRTLTQAADYVRQAATGLAYLHSRGIIHRDVKPANLILANDGTVKLLDMGLVRFASSEDLSCAEMDQELTQAGIVIGTVAYMSPEQALDTRSADQRSDIYSLGCTLFFLLTGRSLYHEETGMKTLLAHREQPVPSLREFCEEAPVSLDAVFRTMVAKRPADRLQSMDEVIAALDACVPPPAAPTGRVGRPLPSAPPVRLRMHGGPMWKSRRFRIAAAITALAAAVLGSIYLGVIVIRITTSQGTTEVSVDDPNAKIEISAKGGAQVPENRPAKGSRQNDSKKSYTSSWKSSPPDHVNLKARNGGLEDPFAQAPQPVPVVPATVHKGDFKVYLSERQGTVSASHTVPVLPDVDGQIQKVLFTEGQVVRAGEVLFEIDDGPYKDQLAKYQTRLASEQAALAEAKKELDRYRKARAAKELSVPPDIVAKLASVDRARAGAEEKIKKDQELIEQTKFQITKCRITAPISGRIGFSLLGKGSTVGARKGISLTEITQLQPVAVIISLPLDDIFHVQQKLDSGKEVLAEAWSRDPGVKLATGKLVGTDNLANPQTGRVQAKCIFSNEDNRLFPNQFVNVRLLDDTLHDVVLVPTSAIRHSPFDTCVFVVKRDKTVEIRPLVVSKSSNGESAVTSGLSPGETIVVEGTDKLVEGSKVIVGFKAETQTPTEQIPTTKSTENLDRQVADWVLANRGTISLKEFRGRTFQFVDALPPTDFHLVTINLKDYVSDDSQSAAPADGATFRRLRSGGTSRRRFRAQNEAAGGSEQTGRTFHRVEFSEADLDRLASLAELRWLTIASSAVTDDVLARLKGLTKLESLGLEGASITDAGLSALSGMTQLTSLDLDSTAVTDAGLKELANLKSLNDLSLIPEAERSGRIPRTRPSLRLGQTRTTVNGIDELQRALPNCIVFASHLGFYPAPPPPGRSDREWAQWLLDPGHGVHVFTDVDPETPISSYEELPPIDFHIVRVGFDSEFSVWVSEIMLRRMARLSKLRSLSFRKLPVSAFAGLTDLKQLEGLWIEETDATDDALDVLGNLTQLKLLQLGDKYFTDRDLARLAPLHELTALRLDGHSKGLHGSGFAALAHLDHLTSLALPDSGIEDAMTGSIAKLLTLEDLDLSRTWITANGLASLASLPRLKKLQLNGCRRLDASSLETLAKFSHLELLALVNLHIDENNVESLKKLTSLRQLYFEPSGGLSPAAFGAIFPALQAALPKCSINGSLGPFDFDQPHQGAMQSRLWNPTSSGRANSVRPQNLRNRGQSGGAENAKKSPPQSAKSPNGKAGGTPQPAAEAEDSGPQQPQKVPHEVELLERMNKETSPDRAIAQWVHAYQGEFGIGENSIIHAGEAIPKGDFHIRMLFISDWPNDRNHVDSRSRASQKVLVPEAVVTRLVKLVDLRTLDLDCRDCTDATVKAIGTLRGLLYLRLRHANITDAGLQPLSELKNLRSLDLRDTAISDKGLQELAKLKLFAEASGVPLARPWLARREPILWLDRTPTTEAGIVEFQRSVPKCVISAAHLMGIQTMMGIQRNIVVETPVPFPPGPGSTDRTWAEWLFANVVDCRILTDVGPETWIATVEGSPPIDFHITGIEFGHGLSMGGGMGLGQTVSLTPLLLRRLCGVPALEAITLHHPQDEFFPAIATLTRLKSLTVGQIYYNISDDALKPLKNISKLTSLRIASSRLTDNGLKSLADLPDLTELALSPAPYLHGSTLKDLRCLPKLKVLNLSETAIDDATLQDVARCSNLEFLALNHTWISPKGLSQLASLPNLKYLDLSNCRQIDATAFDPLKRVKGLRELWMGGSRIPIEMNSEYEGALPGCKILWEADMSRLLDRVHAAGSASAPKKPTAAIAPHAGAEFKSGSGATAALVLPPPGSADRTWAKWILSNFPRGTLLTDADSEMWISTQEGLPPIDFHITQIEFGNEAVDPHLATSFEHLTPLLLRHLADLPQLERLVLYSPHDSLLPAVATLKRLKRLSLRNAHDLSDEALKTVGTMSNLEKLGIQSVQITDASLKNLSNLASLTALDLLDDRNVHGSGLRNLRASTKLEALGLSNSGIDDAGLAEVGRFPNLQRLDLNRTWISPKGLAELARLVNLKHLELIGCRRINDSALEELRKLKSLTSLNLDDTRIRVDLVPKLQSSLPNCLISWPQGFKEEAKRRASKVK